MDTTETNWSQNEFKTYLFLYAANADYIVTETEEDIIKELVDIKHYHKLYAELKNDSDFQSIQKVIFNLKKFNYSKDDIENLLLELKELFLSDGKFNHLEKIMLKNLEKIFKMR